MIQDIQNRQLLKDKSRAAVEQLLGKPDTDYEGPVWGYEVVTILRCHYWVCRMEVYFDKQTGKATGEVAVSD